MIIGVFLLLSSTHTPAQDWPQWRGANRDGKVSAFIAPQKWPGVLTKSWTIKVGLGDATPALKGDKLYAFTRQDKSEVILCLNAASGKELWRNEYETPELTGPAAAHSGPRSSPCVANGKVITLGATGVLSCLDADEGRIVWRNEEYCKVLPAFYTAMSPLVVNGACIVHLGGTDNGEVVAFDLNSGVPKWMWKGDGPAYNSPVLMNVEGVEQIVVLTEKSLVGLAINDGTLLWHVPAPTERMFYNSASPVISGQTVIITGQGSGTKAIKIEKHAYGFIAVELWSSLFGSAFSTPIIKDNLLFGLTDRGYPFCLNIQTGQQLWIAAIKLNRFGAIVDLGTALIILPCTSELIFVDPNDNEYAEMFRHKVSTAPIYAHPIISGNRIYVKDDTSLALWTIE
jgi:outer membrane protein assembly factor BamB